ncbi:hypothetical protein BLSTO_00182 [Blastocystis sp. subtype 1]
MDPVSEIRQRRREEDDTETVPKRSLTKRLEKLDFYPKIGDDYVIKTESGGYVSVISSILMIILFISELISFMSVRREERITIDHTLSEKLQINFNVSLFEIPCDKASIDLMDISGQQQMGVISRIVKIDLDEANKPVNAAFSSVLEEDKLDKNCGSCFGADVSNKCCNSCSELRNAYLKRGWDTWFIDYYAPQCRKDQPDRSNRAPAKGCMVWGVLEVNKVSGNFHIAAGHAQNRDSRHVHSFSPSQIFSFNVTHHIEKLSFGDFIPGTPNPLDSHDMVAAELVSHNYYLKIVPTVYTNATSQVLSNQYSVYEVSRPVQMSAFGQITSLPGVFFVYDITPFMHSISERHMSLAHFLVRICAVIGGVAAIAKLLDTIMYYRAKV